MYFFYMFFLIICDSLIKLDNYFTLYIAGKIQKIDKKFDFTTFFF